MQLDYAAMKREFPKLKAALTRAKKTKDPQKVLDAVETAFARFDAIGYPDRWHLWESAKWDAEFAKARGLPLL